MKALVFGEILWDIFDGEKIIGGAPFNFSAHWTNLGAEAMLLTAVGMDELGTDARKEIENRGIKTDHLRLSQLPTGACHVTLSADGQPSYNLLDNVAYDDITLAEGVPAGVDALYLGTLARRSAVSCQTASQLMRADCFREIFYDINIRRPFISRAVLEEGLAHCTLLKISREESGILTQMQLANAATEEALCRELTARYSQIRVILITLDKDGAMAYDAAADRFITSIKPTSKLVSAVGAGDSFSACFLYSYMKGKSIEESLHRGVLLSDYVVTQMGAIPPVPDSLLRALRD